MGALLLVLGTEKKTAKEEFREQQLKEEAEIRERLQRIRDTLALELEALGSAAIANRAFAHDHLPELVRDTSSTACFTQDLLKTHSFFWPTQQQNGHPLERASYAFPSQTCGHFHVAL
jgi:hypothetical protein